MLTLEQDRKINSIALLYAMEHDITPKIVFDYCMLLCTTDRNSLGALRILAAPEAKALLDIFDARVHEREWAKRDAMMRDAHACLTERLREANCLR